MEEQEKNVKRNKQEESAAVRSEKIRIYLQRSKLEKIHSVLRVANITKSIKIDI
jgi:hypothetical protein